MIDIPKQIAYWQSGAIEEWDLAQDLIKRNKTRHGLFFAHLALEKLLKAHICRHTQDLPPRIHNLTRLAELAGLPLDQTQVDILAEMNIFNLEGRYPDLSMAPLSKKEAKSYLRRAEEVYQWLMSQL
jgi:HEPN domain-containing protein